ncbi:PhzF family phenazine biosynthesis protein [Halobaculum sp. MBLA0147]|uniref:PhzF family phenazine biosynthesis protein n=1 Tax=Halobaculum sp. MBLA0147 TaxID=3079934 RepID=UPI003526BC81
MPDNAFHVVDVFARERYAGNQLAVVHDAAALDTEQMQAITRETNFSECTFVVGETGTETETGYEVRIFDPAEELPFAGHPTLGTAAVLRELVGEETPDEVTLHLGVGDVPVHVESTADGGERYWMRQVPPTFLGTVPDATAADLLGLDTAALHDDLPVERVTTGLPTLVVPLASVDAVRRAETTEPAYGSFVDEYGGHNVLCVAAGGVDGGDLHARVFADWAGVPEDPATGSSNGCLAAYLAVHEVLGDECPRAVVEQGYELDRPSRLHLRVDASGETIVDPDPSSDTGYYEAHGTPGDERRGTDAGVEAANVTVEVGGRVVPVAAGRLL